MSKKLIFILNQELNKRNLERFGLNFLPKLGWKLLVINFRKSNKRYFSRKKGITILSINNFKQFFKSLFYTNNFIDQNTKFFIDHSEYNLLEKLLAKFLNLKN